MAREKTSLAKSDIDAAIARLHDPDKPVSDKQKLALVKLLREGCTLTGACRRKGMPTMFSVYKAMERDPQFAAAMAQARVLQATSRIDRAQDILDEAITSDDIDKIRGAAVYAEQTTKYAEKIAPRDFGQLVKLAGSDGGALIVQVTQYDQAINGGTLQDTSPSHAREEID